VGGERERESEPEAAGGLSVTVVSDGIWEVLPVSPGTSPLSSSLLMDTRQLLPGVTMATGLVGMFLLGAGTEQQI